MKTLRGILLPLLILVVLSNISSVFASNFETIITNISLDNETIYDIEIIPDKGGEILLPVKRIATILNVPYTIDNLTKEITYKLDGNSVKVTKDDVYLNGARINTSKNFYKPIGIMSSTRDEIYTTEKALNKIFKGAMLNLSVDKSELLVSVKTRNSLGVPLAEDGEGGLVTEKVEEFQAYSEVLVPNDRKKISFDTFAYNNSMNGDSVKQMYLESSTNSALLNNTSQFSLKGEAYNGDFSIDFNTGNYSDRLLSFGGLGFTYKNNIKGYNYELGRVTGFQDDFYAVGTDILGVQFFNYTEDQKRLTYKDIEGKVAPNSLVNVYADGEFKSTLSTYGGNYSLRELSLESEPYNIRIEEVRADDTKADVLSKDFKPVTKHIGTADIEKDRDSILAGISGINGRLFAQDGQLYQMNTQKMLVGIEKNRYITEKLTGSAKLVYDKIISQNEDTIWGQSYYNANSILSSGTYQNPNVLDGYTAAYVLDYNLNEKLKLKTTAASSRAFDTSQSVWSGGYNLQMDCEYRRDNYTLRGGVYQQSPKFYLAGSEGAFNSDRAGIDIGGSYKNKYFSASTGYRRYYSNFDNYAGAGLTGFDELSFNSYGRIPKFNLQLKLNANAKKGENLVGQNQNYYYDFNVQKPFKYKYLKNLVLEGGQRANSYETDFVSSRQRDFSSQHSTFYMKSTIKMPNNKGSLVLANDIINYSSNGNSDNYNVMRFGYMFPEIKRVRLYTELGYKYFTKEAGNTFNVGIAYRTKSDSLITLNYQYGKDNGYFIDNMFIPSNMRHSINLTLNDTLAFVPSGLKPVGFTDNSKGFVEVTAFYDKNKNGKRDKGDVPVPNVPIKVSWRGEPLYTGPQGVCQVMPLDKGVYKVGIDSENLKTNLSPSKTTKESQLVIVSPRKITQASFAITSTVGTISGKLSVVDDFGRPKDTKEYIVVLLDENNVEAAYSTVDDNGSYVLAGVEPGRYTLKLDESIVRSNDLAWKSGQSAHKGGNFVQAKDKNSESEGIEINIPFSFSKFEDIKDADLVYKAW